MKPCLAVSLVVVLSLGWGSKLGADPPSALTVCLVRPDLQWQRLIDLFEGSRAPHPAAALAAWKRASGGDDALGKTLEAFIALGNPHMVGELALLDGARLDLGFDAASGQLRWYVALPRDDGTFAALATALALTDGGSDPPLDGLSVDRLGAPLALVRVVLAPDGRLLVAGSRDDLRAALNPTGTWTPRSLPDDWTSGLWACLDPEGLDPGGETTLARRRLAEALRGLRCEAIEATAGLDNDLALRLRVTGRFAEPPVGHRAPGIEPSWLDPVPKTRTLAAVAIAIDPGPDAWNAAFALADRVERTDPARAEVAPLRIRLNLLALTAGLRPEVELWPRLRGITAVALADASGRLDGAVVAVHTDKPASALRIVERLASRCGPDTPGEGDPAGAMRLPGLLGDRPLVFAPRGATVLLGWGQDALTEALRALDDPEHSAGPALRARWGPEPPSRFGAFWPAKALAADPPTALARALHDAPPILWRGSTQDDTTRDVVEWSDLPATVRRFLDQLPLDPG